MWFPMRIEATILFCVVILLYSDQLYAIDLGHNFILVLFILHICFSGHMPLLYTKDVIVTIVIINGSKKDGVLYNHTIKN